jgi:hypothetical protein
MAVINYLRIERFAEMIELTVNKSSRAFDQLVTLVEQRELTWDSGETSVKEIVGLMVVKRMETTDLDHNEAFAEVLVALIGA